MIKINLSNKILLIKIYMMSLDFQILTNTL